ncbi:NAD(P)/FAD-dependent oxidoreductase [Microbacterium deminutum]|uniref:NAD(P)/FAD-dependent oxidoreductase n=1 Tax=Microbacterium deminutum TaxID=344164 RepID=A0ABN2QAC4_9MICO
MDAEVLVVGAGPAGLATAACLQRKGIDALILDRGADVGDTWRSRYDRLHLHTPRIQSALPGLRMPAEYGRWVSKDDVADYLRRYARHHAILPRFRSEVRRLERHGGHWTALTDGGEVSARLVVLATGYANSALRPAWPGQETFGGDILHASEYRTATPYVGRNVLVVGAGNSGAEIAADLAAGGAGTVHLSVRTPPNVIPRQLGPLPTTLVAIPMDYSPAWLVDPVNRLLQRWTLGDLTRYGLPAPRAGLVAQARATGLTPTIDVGMVASLRAGRVMPVAAVERFDGGEVVLVDGSRLTPDAVIAATGYSTGLAPMVGHLGVLDHRGHPLVTGVRTLPSAPGLRFMGLSFPLKGQLLQINLDARAVARVVAAELRNS